jgi:hypothetical protein
MRYIVKGPSQSCSASQNEEELSLTLTGQQSQTTVSYRGQNAKDMLDCRMIHSFPNPKLLP